MPELPWIDWAMLAVLLISVVIGIVRGFVFEVMALAGWLVAWFGAQHAAPIVGPWLQQIGLGEAGTSGNLIAAYIIGFLLILIVWSLLARLVRLLIHATPLSIPDRLLGALFGALRGGVLLLALATVVALTPVAQSSPWQRSWGAKVLVVVLQGLAPLLPAELVRYLPK